MRKPTLLLITLIAVSLAAAAQQKPRVFVTDSQSWEVKGSSAGVDGTFGGAGGGGARPQTAEIIKTFNERCSDVTINNKRDKADYVVVLDHEGGKGGILRDNKIAIFNPDGDSIFSGSTRSLGNAVKDACAVIARDWSDHKYAKTLEPKPAAMTNNAPEMNARVALSSNPAGADVEIDGAYVGSTPSNVHLAPGDHAVTISKKGYLSWQKKIRITQGEVTVNAELEQAR
jgi:hypothetical protein